MSFRLAIVVSSNPLHHTRWCKEFALTKFIGLRLTTMAIRHDIYSNSVLAEKEKLWVATLSHKMCPRIENNLLNQNCLSWYNFSQKIPHPLMPVIVSTYYGTYAVPFLLGHPV